MSIPDVIAKALAEAQPPPSSEAETCQWIILPLLEGLGYQRREIQPQARDGNGQYPDYAILPDTEHKWYLEAKAWAVNLTDNHIRQCLVYAFTNVCRWVVLTNGRQWRLYDNNIQGKLEGKLAAEVSLADVDAAEPFFAAISRESMISGGVKEYASGTRLRSVLQVEMADPNSEVLKATQRVLRKHHDIGRVSGAAVLEALRALAGAAPAQPPPPPNPPAKPKPVSQSTGGRSDDSCDTLVVPARPDGFKQAFLEQNAWWAVRISRKRLKQIKYIAGYQVRPVAAITHVAPVRAIEPHGDAGKYKLLFSESAREIGPIKARPGGRVQWLQSCFYTTYERLTTARDLDEVFIPSPETPKEQEE